MNSYRTYLNRLHDTELEDEQAKLTHDIDHGLVDYFDGLEKQETIELVFAEREQEAYNAFVQLSAGMCGK